jgi:hypothetical protein
MSRRKREAVTVEAVAVVQEIVLARYPTARLGESKGKYRIERPREQRDLPSVLAYFALTRLLLHL